MPFPLKLRLLSPVSLHDNSSTINDKPNNVLRKNETLSHNVHTVDFSDVLSELVPHDVFGKCVKAAFVIQLQTGSSTDLKGCGPAIPGGWTSNSKSLAAVRAESVPWYV